MKEEDNNSKELRAKYAHLFPDKYQKLLARATFETELGVPFQITFSSYEDFNNFHRLFDINDFPRSKFPDEFSVGIFTTCRKCGQPHMAGGTDLALMQLNAEKIHDMDEKGGEIVDDCPMCLMNDLGPKGVSNLMRETEGEVIPMREWVDKKRKKTAH